MGGEVTLYLKEVGKQIAEENDFTIEAMEVMVDQCAYVYRGTANLFAIWNSASVKKYIIDRSIQEIPEDEEVKVEWEYGMKDIMYGMLVTK